MDFFKKKMTIIVIGAVSLFSCVIFVHPHAADAQFGNLACSATFNMSNAVPVWDQATQAQKNVTCTANGIAWQMAHVVLHALTTSVVNWINSGFNGSPSFLTNPEGFFLDAADQATGAFISAAGPLQALCSPFSLDVRLSLALGVTATDNQRYSCTLDKIIQTQQGNVQRLANGQLVNVSVNQSPSGMTIGDIQNGNVLHNSSQLSVNGSSVASVGGFLSGDFNQGGLAGFLALTTEPQNNPFGASLQAQSDLQMQILAKQNSTNNDLNRGAGFLSWQKCDTVPVGGSSGNNYGGEITGAATDQIQTKQVCHTETPGSVISASLNKQLGAPTDELNLTNEINQVVSALFSQLVTKVLSSGLLTSSQPNSSGGVTQSYVNQLTNDAALQSNFNNLKQQTVAAIDGYTVPVQQALTDRTQALAALTGVQSSFASVRACIAEKAQSASAANSESLQTELNALDTEVSTNVTPQVAKYQALVDTTRSVLTNIQNMEAELQAAATADQLNSLNNDFSSSLSASQSSAVSDLVTARADLTTATKTASDLQNALTPFQTVCDTGVTSGF